MLQQFTTEKLKAICEEVVIISKKAGTFMKREALTFDSSKIEYKGSNDLVSYVDKESEKLLVEELRRLLPVASFITEEGTVKKAENDLVWIIDPLDGTTNFLHGLPLYTVSIALLYQNTLLIGVVYEPNLDECFYAWKEGGAYCNGKRMKVSGETLLSKALIATGFPYSLQNKREVYMQLFGRFAEQTQGMRRIGSAALDLAYVAHGRFEGYYEFNLKIWDIAAGILLVKEAGGKVSDYGGGSDYLFGKEIVAAGGVHEGMLAVMRELWH